MYDNTGKLFPAADFRCANHPNFRYLTKDVSAADQQ
jgi:hypothetical protein